MENAVTPPTSPEARTPSVDEARRKVKRIARCLFSPEFDAALDALLTAVRQEEREACATAIVNALCVTDAIARIYSRGPRP
jgi:hypothetical protein